MKTYFRNGTMKEIPHFYDDREEFYIQELESEIQNSYIYPGDSINYALDGELCILCDTFRDMIFENVDQYYSELDMLPIWVQDAGQSSDCSISADTFIHWIQDSNIPNLHKHLYLVDCQFLVGTIQNLLCAMDDAFVRYYQIIATTDKEENAKGLIDGDGTICVQSQSSIQASAMIETYFIKAYSILDIVCKICYEIQFKKEDFSTYRKIKSADVLWGARKELVVNGKENTVFENCDLIRIIEALRNELVHNGTWELRPKKFVRFEKGMIQERFMLFPDITQGHLSTVKSRKHFFATGTKVNDILPCIHAEFKNRLLKTIEMINSNTIFVS